MRQYEKHAWFDKFQKNPKNEFSFVELCNDTSRFVPLFLTKSELRIYKREEQKVEEQAKVYLEILQVKNAPKQSSKKK